MPNKYSDTWIIEIIDFVIGYLVYFTVDEKNHMKLKKKDLTTRWGDFWRPFKDIPYSFKLG